jgi:hypothetical protein
MTKWIKSKISAQQGACVEVSKDEYGVKIRNSRMPEASLPRFTFQEFDAFIKGAKDGDFDHLLTD